ncbi:class I adenylate-forming enzyme family protein [Candidatus Marithrix sp. Canyon 246]|uniref:class I adenylate-forming enzyme family protein n=1 Tax=Candidatus Marithrix sp. Canyon 246 TaxID=1827136 RepID=UPI000849F9F8|nr:class I adenylate-forming enzyme family protein [Candidatus Marithrix sp. Canyon 246]
MYQNNVKPTFLCLSCRENLKWYGFNKDTGHFVCPKCGVGFPSLDGFLFFTEGKLFIDQIQSDYDQLRKNFWGNLPDYSYFIKQEKSVFDSYAAFQPFNESTRALFPLLKDIAQQIKPKVPILDLWGRTGWSGELLASLFPDNPIFMVWEGNKNVLGYHGYCYWLKKRSSNLHVIFLDIEKGLPFKDNFFGLIHGLDTFHRYSHSPLIGECLRVAKKSAALVFPHIHLTNSEPSPYFDRGCIQYHGNHYRKYLDRILKPINRKSYLLSEQHLFELKNVEEAQDDPDMSHYNALLYIAPVGQDKLYLYPSRWARIDIKPSSHFLINPLLDVDLNSSNVKISSSNLAGHCQYLLSRHPLYYNYISKHFPYQLSDRERQVLFCLQQGLSLGETSSKCQIDFDETAKYALSLQERDIGFISSVSDAMFDLQNFYSTLQIMDPVYRSGKFSDLWQLMESNKSNPSIMISAYHDEEFSWNDVREIVLEINAFLVAEGLNVGDNVAIISPPHPEYLLVIWACWLSGLVAVPICHEWSETRKVEVLQEVKPKALFLEYNSELIPYQSDLIIHFDPLSESNFKQDYKYLSDYLTQERNIKPRYADYETAVILYTSGSTGKAKGVVHSFSALYRGASKLAANFNLISGSRFLGLGGFHTMSGLRNAAVLGFVANVEIILPDIPVKNSAQTLIELCQQYHPDTLVSTPILAKIIYGLKDRLSKHTFSSLKLWLITGARASKSINDGLKDKFSIDIGTYYGLTETGGICTVNKEHSNSASIGKPVGALIDIVKNTDEKIGEIRVFSDQLMQKYCSDYDGVKEINSGWFYTNDFGYKEQNGDIILLGRKDDQINLPNGEILYLNALESEVKEALPNVKFGIGKQYNNKNA